MKTLIILYSTGCPKCIVLKEKLDAKGIKYTINNNTEEMAALGITQVPVLRIGETLYPFKEANAWINQQ